MPTPPGDSPLDGFATRRVRAAAAERAAALAALAALAPRSLQAIDRAAEQARLYRAGPGRTGPCYGVEHRDFAGCALLVEIVTAADGTLTADLAWEEESGFRGAWRGGDARGYAAPVDLIEIPEAEAALVAAALRWALLAARRMGEYLGSNRPFRPAPAGLADLPPRARRRAPRPAPAPAPPATP